MRIRLKHIHTDKDRFGNERVYFQKGRGAPKIRIRSPRNTPEFLDEYRAAANMEPVQKRAKFAPQTFGAMIEAYYESPEFRVTLKASTQTVRKRILDKLKAKHGHKLTDMQRKHVLELRNEVGLKPHAANNRLKVLKALFKWALDVGKVESNPTREVSKIKLKSDGFIPWTADEIDLYRQRHPSGTKARLALEILLNTGARRSDAVTFGRQLVQNGVLRYRQGKTGNWVEMPINGTLAAELAYLPPDQVMWLMTAYGKPFTANGFGGWMRKRCNEAEVSKSSHGLRKSGASMAAERGATASQIQAFGGWSSLVEAEKYTRAASREKLAGGVVKKLERKRTK